MNKEKRNLIAALLFSLFLVIVLIPSILAHHVRGEEVRRLCLDRDQSIPSEINPKFTCESDLCIVCVDRRGNLVDLDKCDDVPECSPIQDEDEFVDNKPPKLDVFLPVNNQVYNDRRILVHIETDEFVDMELIDNSFNSFFRGTRGVGSSFDWRMKRTLCNNCIIFRDFISFREGFHILDFRATDMSGNFVSKRIEIFVDSIGPRIIKVEPRRNFANGEFSVQFREENPVSVKFFYGNTFVGFNSLEIGDTCTFFQRRHDCNVNVDLSNFDGFGIEFWFAVEDVAERQDVSRIERLEVDVTPPKINNVFFNALGRSANIALEIEEKNFHFAEYIDRSGRNQRWNRLCSRLGDGRFDDGICRKRITLSGFGIHDIRIRVWDKAGNFVEESLIIEN